MPLNLLLIIAIAVGAVAFYRWLRTRPPGAARQQAMRTATWLGIGFLLFLVATGRLNWLVAVIGSALVAGRRLMHVLSMAPALHQLFGQFRTATASARPHNRHSSIETAYLSMQLDQDSGAVSGRVLNGRFTGRSLNDLTPEELAVLWRECEREDPESVPLLEAFLERAHGADWRDTVRVGPDGDASQGMAFSATMTDSEALQILGLADGASEQEIRDAHRRLIQKLHPDRGGSSYLATKINQAKDHLLAKKTSA